MKVLSVRDLLSGTYVFHLPWFQRAYAWHTMEVGRLLTNVLEVMQDRESPPRYFLGKIMLAQPNGAADTSLVDGHQRVMTLTLLFAVLRDLEHDPDQSRKLQAFIGEPGHHLRPQQTVADFIRQFVQEPGATYLHPETDLAELSETQRNIVENRDYLLAELQGIDLETRRALANFVADQCKVLKCAVKDEDEAWHILQVEEDTRVDFTRSDRAKWTLLSIVPPDQRGRCQQLWEQCEALVGANDLYALLNHLRVMRLRSISDRPVEADLALAYAMDNDGLDFMEKVLTPAATFVAHIRAGTLGPAAQQATVARYVRQMTWIDPQFWMPVALNWLLRRGENDKETDLFFRLLERLVWFIRLSGADPIKRQRHIIRLLGEMDRGASPAKLHELEISKSMLNAALESLRAPTFDAKHYATRLLRRVSVALGQDPGPIHPAHVTLEHILPRSFAPDGPWRVDFPHHKSVQSNAHRLGNLTFLTAADNQAADTLDWNAKRTILASSEFVLSKRAGSPRRWTAASISERTEDLIAILLKDWKLT